MWVSTESWKGRKMKYCFLRYIGGKHRITGEIAKRLRDTGKNCLVEVFGGSAAVMLNSGFEKRVYNDLDGDLVNLFRVMANRELRRELLQQLRCLPISRQIFNEDSALYARGGYSFAKIKDKVERARATFYRQAVVFGGKMRNGGFQVSAYGRKHVKEIGKYRDNLKRFAEFGEFFRNTVIENLHYRDLIRFYGKNRDVVLFVDPPYPGIKYDYYSIPFGKEDHFFLADQLLTTPAPVVCTFYDNETVRELYPEKYWKYDIVRTTKNSGSQIYGHHKEKVNELILTRKEK